MFSLKGHRWVHDRETVILEHIHQNFNTLNECIRHAEKKACDQFKVFNHQSEMVHWFRREHEPCDFS